METKLVCLLVVVLGVACYVTEAGWTTCYRACMAKHTTTTTSTTPTPQPTTPGVTMLISNTTGSLPNATVTFYRTTTPNATVDNYYAQKLYDSYVKRCKDYCNHHWFELQYNPMKRHRNLQQSLE